MIQKKTRVKREYWVTNITTDRNVGLRDLALTIRKGQTVNLLDDKHYSYTYEQLEKSRIEGSIHAKSNMIKVRDLQPIVAVNPGIHIATTPRYHQIKFPAIAVEDKWFEELGDEESQRLAEEKFAEAESDIVHNDNVPALPVDNVYKKS